MWGGVLVTRVVLLVGRVGSHRLEDGDHDVDNDEECVAGYGVHQGNEYPDDGARSPRLPEVPVTHSASSH